MECLPVKPVAPRMTMSYFRLRTSEARERGGEGEDDSATADIFCDELPPNIFLYKRERRRRGARITTARGSTTTTYKMKSGNAFAARRSHPSK